MFQKLHIKFNDQIYIMLELMTDYAERKFCRLKFRLVHGIMGEQKSLSHVFEEIIYKRDKGKQ